MGTRCEREGDVNRMCVGEIWETDVSGNQKGESDGWQADASMSAVRRCGRRRRVEPLAYVWYRERALGLSILLR